MATQQPTCGKPAALQGAEAGYRLHRVHRARGVKATGGPQQRTDPALVTAQYQYEQTINHDSFMRTGSY